MEVAPGIIVRMGSTFQRWGTSRVEAPRRFVPRGHGRAALLGLMAAPLLAWAQPTEPGTILVSRGAPGLLLRWTNAPGWACVVEATDQLRGSHWEARAVLTTDAPDLSWLDEALSDDTRFYRVSLCPDPAPFQRLQQALERARLQQGIIGASAAAWLPDRGLWLGTSGESHPLSPIRPQTRFEIGSVSKTFVAVAVLREVEAGRLGLEDTLAERLPGLSHANINPSITIRQLLNHRAGIYNFGDDPQFRQALFSNGSRYWLPEQVLGYVKAPYFAPDHDGQYSNTGYILLGMVLQSTSGTSVAEVLHRAVFEPCGLNATTFGAEEPWSGHLAHPHLDFNGDGIHEDLVDRSQTAILSSFWTSGAVISTAADIARFGRQLFAGNLLSEASLAGMKVWQPVDIGGTGIDYGLGLMRFDVEGREVWAHSGGLFGHYAWLSFCPSTGVALGIAYNHPQTQAGPNLPGELLLELNALADEAGPVSSARRAHSAMLPEFPWP